MSWCSELVPGRIVVGPFVMTQLDALYLTDKMRVTHVVNMMPRTDDVTQNGHNKATWNECLFPEESRITFLREPVPLDLATMNDAHKQRFYLSAAQRVAGHMKENPRGVYYFHKSSGFDEEAFLALVTWATLMPSQCNIGVAGVSKWLFDNSYERLLDDELELYQFHKDLPSFLFDVCIRKQVPRKPHLLGYHS